MSDSQQAPLSTLHFLSIVQALACSAVALIIFPCMHMRGSRARQYMQGSGSLLTHDVFDRKGDTVMHSKPEKNIQRYMQSLHVSVASAIRPPQRIAVASAVAWASTRRRSSIPVDVRVSVHVGLLGSHAREFLKLAFHCEPYISISMFSNVRLSQHAQATCDRNHSTFCTQQHAVQK